MNINFLQTKYNYIYFIIIIIVTIIIIITFTTIIITIIINKIVVVIVIVIILYVYTSFSPYIYILFLSFHWKIYGNYYFDVNMLAKLEHEQTTWLQFALRCAWLPPAEWALVLRMCLPDCAVPNREACRYKTKSLGRAKNKGPLEPFRFRRLLHVF